MSATIPEGYGHLLELPIYAHLGTVRPDGQPQVNPMWFEFDGEHLLFTHTTKRAKYRNLHSNPRMSLSLLDPREPFRYLEVRGTLVGETPDPEGEFYVRLGRRYGIADTRPPADRADRVILRMSVESFTKQ